MIILQHSVIETASGPLTFKGDEAAIVSLGTLLALREELKFKFALVVLALHRIYRRESKYH